MVGQKRNLQQEFVDPIYDIHMLNKDTGWAVGGDFVFHTTNGSLVTSVIENHDEEEVFKVFPNPASYLITVQLPHTFISPGMLTIYNDFGETVMRKEISGLNRSFAIDVSNFINGIYFLSINSNSTTMSTKLIVKH